MAKIIGNAGNIALCTPKTTEAIIKLWDKHVIQGKGWDSDSLTLVINAASYSITSILAAKNLGETFGNIRGELTDIVTSQCFIAGTLVLAEDGEKPIEDIEVGDYVYASDPETGESGYKEVLNVFIRQSNIIIRVFVNGEEIETTPTHPFWVENEWVPADKLKSGDVLTLADGTTCAIDRVYAEFTNKAITVYNFEVADFHSYYVTDTGVLVHNAAADSYGISQSSSFEDLMTPEEAERYNDYWKQGAGSFENRNGVEVVIGKKGKINTRQRLQVSPGTRSIFDVKYGKNGMYYRETIFDEYGRRIGNNDYTNHGRGDHTNPHYHANSPFDPQMHGNNTPGLHPQTPNYRG